MRIQGEVSDRVTRWLSVGAVLATLCCLPSVSAADVLWSWSFSTESGTFVTDGAFSQTGGATVFTFKRFSVSASLFASNVGATYNEGGQPIQTMSWDGSQPTQFTRANGAFTNGSNFYNNVGGHRYGLGVPNGLMLDFSGDVFASGPLTVVPLGDVIPEGVALAPAASTTGIAFMTSILLLGGALSLRRRHRRLVGSR